VKYFIKILFLLEFSATLFQLIVCLVMPFEVLYGDIAIETSLVIIVESCFKREFTEDRFGWIHKNIILCLFVDSYSCF
jgi:hypothetical protein